MEIDDRVDEDLCAALKLVLERLDDECDGFAQARAKCALGLPGAQDEMSRRAIRSNLHHYDTWLSNVESLREGIVRRLAMAMKA
jgi:hypothetical protein